ncbi:toprim domain-containing protein [Zongyangia hominis]|uniref:DUF4093 domain-containing protein n=1 Tax=Zongyangia hominis TaxID=2763677 RepID=A0A926EEN9_9FIRM|nr:DUF4093 domain-containing protein [Zongyangia hominis]MBC8570789.1 DUF4093 domain-containing protein [Zongyangia hominis]
MISLKETVVVEGKYDKIKLASLLNATIIAVDGFRIFTDKETLALLRALADKTGLVILTDSDAAGFKIRHYIAGAVNPNKVRHAYISDIFGKESRKEKPSKEGKLGVEGVSQAEILRALTRAGVLCEEGSPREKGRPITKTDFFADGLTGAPDAGVRRKRLIERLGLPEHLSANGLLQVLNALMDYEGYRTLIEELF